MSEPPNYASAEQQREERLKALQEFAESKEYVKPGDAGVLTNFPTASRLPRKDEQHAYPAALPVPQYSDVVEPETKSKRKLSSSLKQMFRKGEPSKQPDAEDLETKQEDKKA